MPYRVMIANRGEIAVRIARTLLENGYIPVGIYEHDDEDSLHRKFMAEDIEVSSYLDIKEVVNAAVELGADAVHPGYGFLSENPEFAREVVRKGILFIGPSPDIMALSGDKLAAKTLAEKLGVPTLPWTVIEGVEDIVEFARVHGYPVIIKAAGGGGGRGVRAVWSEKEAESSYKTARIEAERAFKDPRLYVEPLVQRAKHIEIQILGDGDNIIHLYERECSIQRRYQKVIEEAPSPSLTEEERNTLYNYALTLARGLRYVNAGTVEFLFDVDNRRFYFMEINSRLQVEHPVTEMITGVDIVKKQVEIAFYSTLDLKQGDIKREGNAIEARIYAESPYSNEPSVGKITRYQEPGGPGIRIDSGVIEGSRITGRYDSLILKIISWGPSRAISINRLDRALSELVIEGVSTNVSLIRQIIRSRDFANATYITKFLSDSYSVLREKILEDAKIHSIIAASLMEFDDKSIEVYTRRERKIKQVLSSEKVSSLKRYAWYYYASIRGALERHYLNRRREGGKIGIRK